VAPVAEAGRGGNDLSVPEVKRKFKSPMVEHAIGHIQSAIGNKELACWDGCDVL
jgi:hypothetical protein